MGARVPTYVKADTSKQPGSQTGDTHVRTQNDPRTCNVRCPQHHRARTNQRIGLGSLGRGPLGWPLGRMGWLGPSLGRMARLRVLSAVLRAPVVGPALLLPILRG